MGYIYKITNKINKKCYIGQTIGDLNKRWKGHQKVSSNCRYLKHALNKYGVNNFKFELVCICFNTNLDKYEIEYINKYNSLVPNGYNLRHGGDNETHHQLTKDKISKSLKEYYTINKSPMFGKKLSEETKQKLSKAHIGRKYPTTEKKILQAKKQMRKVIQLDMNDNILNRYESVTEAAEKNNVTKAVISMVCNKKRIQVKGYKYIFEDVDNLNDLMNDMKL